jgi:hypothetical protein
VPAREREEERGGKKKMWEIVGMRASMFSVEQKQKEREKNFHEKIEHSWVHATINIAKHCLLVSFAAF